MPGQDRHPALARRDGDGAGHRASLDYAIARLWFRATYGAENGQAEYERAKVTIKHPDEFQVAAVLEAVTDTKAALSLGLGTRAEQRLKERALTIVLPDLPQEDLDTIRQEIEAGVGQAQTAPETFRDALTRRLMGQPDQTTVTREEVAA